MLANLLEVISGAKLEGKLDKNPKFLAQQVVNLELCWALLKTKLDPKARSATPTIQTDLLVVCCSRSCLSAPRTWPRATPS